MKNKFKWSWVVFIVIIIIIIVIIGISKYNKLATMKNNVNIAWSQVENQYQRRFDLTPQLVDSVKQVLKQEGSEDVYEKLAQARSAYTGATSINDKITATQNFDGALSRLIAVVESYPQLKASENIKDLTTSIEGTENRIAVERGRFNDTTGIYDGYILRFPNNLFAKVFGFEKLDTFKAADGSQTAPQVGELFNQ